MWFNSTMSSLKKLSTSYNSALRRLQSISKPYCNINMFVSRGIPTLSELMGNFIHSFTQRINDSTHCIVGSWFSPLLYLSSPIHKYSQRESELNLHCDQSSLIYESSNHVFYCLSFVLAILTYRLLYFIL